MILRLTIGFHFRKIILLILSVALTLSLIPLPVWGAGVAHTSDVEDSSASVLINDASSLLPKTPKTASMPDGLTGFSQVGVAGLGEGRAKARTTADQAQPMANMSPLRNPSSASPVSISRIQSAYRGSDAISGTLMVTFTLTNNQVPAIVLSQSSISATMTETLTALSTLDPSSELNTIRNVILVDTLTSNATLVSSSPATESDGSQFVINLGDIPPLGAITTTLVLSVPNISITDFFDLDTGAMAWGTLQDRMVSARARSISLAPDTINGEPTGDWLKWTVDADKHDQYLLEKAAELGQDPIRMFEYVRSLGYESYKGSLRGTRGTLWGEAGNSLDQASLLIAMLRASGIPARYRHGTLGIEQRKELILSMFRQPTQLLGRAPAITGGSANDPKFIAETQDHWWVEAYLPGLGWRDLDPSFDQATIGQCFVLDGDVAADGTDRIAEVPDSLRYKVTIQLKVERYDQLSYLAGGFNYVYPLTHTVNTVELTGEPITLRHLVAIEAPGLAAVFYWVKHIYTPYLLIKDEAFKGQPYQNFISNFPFSNYLVTGEWLIFDIRDVDGNVNRYEREIVDRIGFENRQNGGVVAIEDKIELGPLVSDTDQFVAFFGVSTKVPVSVLLRHQSDLVRSLLPDLQKTNAQLSTIRSDTVSSQDLSSLANADIFLNDATRSMLTTIGLEFYSRSGISTRALDHTFATVTYPVTPRIIMLSSQQTTTETMSVSIDLLKNDLRVVASSIQNPDAVRISQFTRGLADSFLETQILEEAIPDSTALSTYNVMRQAAETGIPFHTITRETLNTLTSLEISSEAKARILTAVNSGKMIVTPECMIHINGKPTVGWWEINPETFESVGVMESGQHQSLTEQSGFRKFLNVAQGIYKDLGANLAYKYAKLTLLVHFAWGYLLQRLTQPWTKGALRAAWEFYWAIKSELAHIANLSGVSMPPETRETLIRIFQALEFLQALDPPLPDFLASRPERPVSSANNSEGQSIYVAGRSGIMSGGVLERGHFAFSGDFAVSWISSSHTKWDLTKISAGPAQIFSSSNTFLGIGNVNAVSLHKGLALTAGVGLRHDLSSHGDASYYAPAFPGLGAGSNWITYTAQLTSTQPYTLELRDVVVTVNGMDTYTGSFTLVTTDTTYIEGFGHTAVPNFADAAYMQTNDAHLMIGPASGTFLVGGEPVDASNGLAIAGYTGPLTITEATSTTDQIELNGDASFFTLATVPTTTIAPAGGGPVNFNAVISANFTDTYTTTVEAPQGWNVELDDTGLITATSPLGAEPGEYTILVMAQSGAYPDLFASAVHTVTTVDYQGMALNVNPDLLITMPFGPIDPSALPGDTNNGQMQIPGAAFTIDITNTSTTSHTFAINVNDLPAGWLILSGAEGQTTTTLTLPAGGLGQIGLYISPTLAALPPAHTEYPFTVNAVATDNPALTQSDADVFTVPEIAFSQVEAAPAVVYSSPGLTTTFDVGLHNVGNTAGSFPLLVTQPISTWTAAINSPLAVGAGQVLTQNVVLNTPDGEIGRDYNLNIAAPSGAYTQTTNVNVQLVGPCVLQVQRATQLIEQVAGSEGSLGLVAAWQNLTFQLREFELKPGQILPRQRVISATQSVIDHFSTTFPVSTAGLQAIVTDLADNTTAAEDSATVAAYCAPVTDVIDEIKRVTDRAASIVVQPGTATTLTDRPITYTVHLLNRGTLTTTYDLAVDGLDPAWLSAPTGALTGSIALEPDQIGTWSFTATPTALGTYPFTVTVTAQEDALVQYHSRVMLRAVDAFVKVLEVAAYPDFVDPGSSYTNLSMQLANQADLSQPALVEVQVTAPDSTSVLTSSVPITLSAYDSQIRRINLGVLNTSGFVTGVYTIGVTITDLEGRFMPQGRGFGKFSVGQAISATARVEPQIVAPGNPVVTTTIETHLPGSLRMDLNWTRSIETDTIQATGIGNAVSLSRALALPTYPDLVWDNGTIAPGNSHLVPPGHLWASWRQKYPIDMRHFRGTFTLPVGRNITTTDGILASPYYSPTMVPINDNIYIYLNGVLQFHGGTNYGSPRGIVPETDYWYIPTGARLNGIHEGENVIDIVTEERMGWGALGYTELTLLQPLGDVRYQVDTLHQIPISGIQVLTETVTPLPAAIELTPETNDYLWQHELSPTQRLQTMTFASQLSAMQPGEIRQVSADTIVSYTVASGRNQLHLGSLYVVAPHIIQIEPSSQVVAPGGQAAYAVNLYNPALYTDTFTLSISGLPAEWVNLPAPVTLGAGMSQTVTLMVQPPSSAEESDWSFGVVADAGNGGREGAQVELSVRTALQVAVQPEQLTAGNNQTVTYTVSITNTEATFRTYSLTVAGLTENTFTLPETIGVAPSMVMTVPLAVTAHAPRGWYPFEVQAAYASDNGSLSAAAEAVLIVTSDLSVMATLSPALGIGGPSVPVLYHLTVTNTGSLSDTYSFNVDLPTGWTYRLEANGSPVTTLSLTPYVFNAAELWLIVTPSDDAAQGSYNFEVEVQSQHEPSAQAQVVAALTVTERGVKVAILPAHTTMAPTAVGTWQVVVTNTGTVVDSYTLMAGGIVSGSAQFTPTVVTLSPGVSQIVELTSYQMDFALPQTYPFAVTVQSSSDANIRNYATADITFTGYEAVQVELLPASQVITDSLQASYLFVITNTGNIDTIYRFSTVAPGLTTQWEVDEVYIPAHMTAGVLLTVRASGAGTYTINASAASTTSSAQASATASLTVVLSNQPPVVEAGTDQTADEGNGVLFNGSFTDPDTGDTHTVHWNFGDGATASGSLTPTHVYADNGTYTVTLTITDHANAVGQDTLYVTVNNVAPIVDAGSDQTSAEGESVSFIGTFTDAGTVDTQALLWDFGDGSTAAGVLTPTHVYVDNPGAFGSGVYTATLTVTDKDGGSGTDMVQVVVSNVSPGVEAGPDRVTSEGAALQFTGTFTDPGTADTHLIEWDFGDGGAATGSLTPTHTYTQSGAYTTTLTITDDDGGIGSDALAVTVQPGATSCTTVTIQGEGVADAYIWGTYPDVNYNYDRLYTGKVVDGDKRSLLRFDLSSLPVNTTIERATFSLNQFVNSDATTVEAHRIISGWIEDEVTWNSFNNAYDPSLVGSWLPGANGWYSLEVTSLVQAWVAGTWPNYGVLLDQPTGEGHAEYRATEYEDEATERPRLTLCYQSGPELPVADFSAAPVRGAAPLTVTFSNQSTPLGAITAYLWDFGDGTSTSSESAPTHVYTEIGTYTVTLQITVGGQTYQKTQTDYINVTSFPSTGVLDDFNRAPGVIGSHWSGSDAIYAIANHQLDVQPGDGALLWNAYAFGADQEAYVTLVNVDLVGLEQDLLLKSQSGGTWEHGVIEVLYRAAEQQVQVWTYTPQQNWVKQGDDIPVQLVNGDQLGARARADGTVEVYRNGILLATRDVTTWPYYANGGYIGLWSIDAADAVLDDFGGATTGSIAPMPDLVAFWDDFDPSQETWTYTATLGTDDWQLATDYAHSLSHAYYTSDPDALKDDRLQTRSLVVPPHGQLTFWHTYQLENQCDGAVLEISTDGGATFTDLGASILAGGYTGILTCSTNPILTRPAWTGGELGTMSQVTVDLSAFAGQTVLLRFRLVADDGTGGGGWYLDDVRVQGTQVAEILPRPGLNTLLAGASTGFYRSVDAPYSDWPSLASLYAAANTQLDGQASQGSSTLNK